MTDPDLSNLIRTLGEALDMLPGHGDPHGTAIRAPDPLLSLLQQCETLCAEIDAAPAPAIRTLHHFACTGGTLIAKCIAALPGTVLLSEVDPLSTLHLSKARKPFFPTDFLADLHVSIRPAPASDIADIFLAGVLRMRDLLAQRGQNLVIRDHAHSQFCTDADMTGRATVLAILRGGGPVRALLTLRHPLDSFLALQANGWTHFKPFTLEDYSLRYQAFLAAHADVPRVRYEDFVTTPETVLSEICAVLDLPFNPDAIDLIEALRLSGDSGRSGATIAPRPRRAVPDDIATAARNAPGYQALCNAMGYDPDPGAA